MSRLFGNWRVKRRKGVSIIECVILMVILAIAIGAIMSTAIWSSELRISTKGHIGTYIAANNWFEAAEALPPASFDMGVTPANFAETVAGVTNLLGGANRVDFKFDVRRISSGNGTHSIELTISNVSLKNEPFVVTRSLNAFSNATVPDNAGSSGNP